MNSELRSFSLKTLPALAFAAVVASLMPGAVQAAAPAPPGKIFKDCKDCPEMVVLPTGTFTMGTPDNEVGREPDEGPLHPVTFAKPLAISRFQVLAGEWDAYLRDSGYVMPDGDTRPGRECKAGVPRYERTARHPAVCMDFPEVNAYVAWLSKKTGKHYRLVSESLREYAARAGNSGPFPFPFDEGKEYSIAKHANTYGAADGYNFTSPAGSFPANAFGVYDMHGNVYEWTADCYNENYTGAPSDGSAWLTGDCKARRIRGNDWGEAPVFSRSGNRNATYPDTRGDWIGFRVARDL
ncbi:MULTISPECIES: dihydropyoverdine dehydrogenase [Gammaproteobacteria]|uniref:Chromophore maturation protein PvdO n=1 Tax=Pseudomonas lini TaxID=163011 RepID=A0A423IQG2_9PSED|nr:MULTISPECIES: formylglycine-generating enzyme family protein [Gammaproteobacteria]MBK5304632.1 formylglycine-generating enzyme family protein [Bacillus sp. TH86]MBK5324401.1 formylglycine-generating enzyme family protein [Bacillus sp. TH59]MBK5339351.1 formylglycine-generating enzyme family protein [Bacillus sp. TH57]MBK5313399.1 formylglycine-generating enzyme family protein [Pseudomonas sp. TH71]MBK5318898.1 formylglycine-generating enzyme family protein [Erwinia sp. TH79]